jgi:hypothetical protein
MAQQNKIKHVTWNLEKSEIAYQMACSHKKSIKILRDKLFKFTKIKEMM